MLRIEEVFSQLRSGPVGQAYWQIRAMLAQTEIVSALSERQRTAIEEARLILEDSSELKVIRLLADIAGKDVPQWPEAD